MAKKSRPDNPMPASVYMNMIKYDPNSIGGYRFDLHHCLVTRRDVQGMPLEEKKRIHDKRNLWWVRHDLHASHAAIEDKRVYYRLLCQRWGKDAVDEFVRSFNWKSTPPVTVEWLESEE